jgi:hypothetical protein
MKKFRFMVFFLIAVLFLNICFLSVSSFSTSNTLNVVNGYKLFDLTDTQEYNYDSSTVSWIQTYSSALNNPTSVPSYAWSTYNEWWDNDGGTYRNNIQAFLQFARTSNNIEFVAQFWTGDFAPLSTSDPWHYGLHTRDSNVSDSEIFNWNAGGLSLNYFSMIWTCVNGGKEWDDNIIHHNVDAVIGSYTPYGWNDPMPTFTPSNPNTQYGSYNNGYLGVALGFTGAGVASLPYANKCYIGFLGHSPWLKDIHNGQNGMTNWGVGSPIATFVRSFYEHLCGYDDYGQHPTIIASLDHASSDYFGFGTYWENTPLHSGWWEKMDLSGMGGTSGWYFHQMELWGNSNLCLPRGDTEW